MLLWFSRSASASSAPAQSGWVEVGHYQNQRDTRLSTTLYARLMSSKWDQLSESKVVIFQINLQGKDVGAMEFDAMCRTGLFTWERQIVVPTSGARYFSSGTEPYFQKAKIVARDIFCSR